LIKFLIIVLLIGVVLSLFGGLAFLFKDSELPESKRALYTLGIRISLAAALLLTVFFGFYTGQLRMGSSAPWHQRSEHIYEQEQAHPDHVNEMPVPRRRLEAETIRGLEVPFKSPDQLDQQHESTQADVKPAGSRQEEERGSIYTS